MRPTPLFACVLIALSPDAPGGCAPATPTPTPPEAPTPDDGPRPDDGLGEISMLRADAHGHPYDRDGGGQIYVDGGAALGEVVAGNNLGLVLASVRADAFTIPANGATIASAAQTIPQLVPLLWCTPGHGGTAEEAEPFLRDQGFAGLKFHPAIDALPADSPLMDPFIELAARYRVPVVIHTASDDPSRPWRVAALAERHPDVDIVLYHGGLGTDQAEAFAAVTQHPNTWFETSWVPYSQAAAAIEALGPGRVIFGTDVSIDGPQHYQKSWSSGVGDGSWAAWLRALGTDLPRSSYRQVLVENTFKLFNLVTVHARDPGGSAPHLRYDGGHGLGPVWSMAPEAGGWYRRTVPSRGPLRFVIEVDGKGGPSLTTSAWEVWVEGDTIQTPPPLTTVRVHYDAGPGRAIFLRGSGWPLSWSAGEPAQWTDGNVWTLTLAGVTEPLELKALLGDATWEQGPNHAVAPGGAVDLYPEF